jgi:hypothetical protein
MADAVRRTLYVLMGLAALVNGGCLVVAAGAAAAGGAGAAYAYMRGALYREYPSTLTDSYAAARSALTELQMPIVREEPQTVGQAYLESRTGDGNPVRVYLTARATPIPTDGPVTRVSVRVGAFGDDVVSTKLLDQIDRHLTPVAPPTAAAAPPPPRPPETPPPPLAK